MPFRKTTALCLPIMLLAACNDHSANSSGSETDPVDQQSSDSTEATASAPDWRSEYTSLSLEDCIQTYRDDESGATDHTCPGRGDIELFAYQTDGRMHVDIGAANEDSVSISPFNHLGETVEWRIAPDGRVPAAIIRYTYDLPAGSDMPASELAVITVAQAGNPSCYVAFARTNDEARKIAESIEGRACLTRR